jgi:HSP20 family protein
MTLQTLVPVLNHPCHPSRVTTLDPYRTWQIEVNRLFDDMLSGMPFMLRKGERPAAAAGFIPRVDLSETEKEIRVSAELPGLEEKDVSVELEQETLIIQGERKEEQEEKGRNWHGREQAYGSFQRVIPLPVAVAGDKVRASFQKGLLTVTLPKLEEAQPRRKVVKIESA